MTFDISKMNTRLSLQQITEMVTRNQGHIMETGDQVNVVLPPGRLSYCNIAKKGVVTENGVQKEGKFGTNILFTPNADLSKLKALRDGLLAKSFPQNPTGAGMKNPFRNQGDRVSPAEGGTNIKGKTTPGYTVGWPFIIPTSNYRPALFTPPFVPGPNGQPAPSLFVGDEKAIEEAFYPGAWVIAVVNAFVSKNQQNPGVFFGLQSLLKIADDNKLGGAGGGVNPQAAFGGVNLGAGAGVDPQSLF